MATTRTRKPRATRTRAEVAAEFEQLSEELEGAEPLAPQASVLATEHAAKTRSAVTGLSRDVLTQKTAVLGLEVARTLAQVTEQSIAKFNELETLESAVALEKAELEKLYKLDVAAASIQELIREHEETKERHQKEVAATQLRWHEEQVTHAKLAADRAKELEVSRKREADEFEYKKKMDRQADQDQWARTVAMREQAMSEKAAVFLKEIEERQAAIEKEEAEIAQLKARVAGIEEEISKASAKAVAVATNSLKKDMEHAHALTVAGLENRLVLAQQTIASNVAANDKLTQQVEQLSKALDNAKQQVQDIAVKALESASGQTALAQVQSTLRENGAARGPKS